MLSTAFRVNCRSHSCSSGSSGSSCFRSNTKANSCSPHRSSPSALCAARRRVSFPSSRQGSTTSQRIWPVCQGLKENVAQLAPTDNVGWVDVMFESDATGAPASSAAAAVKHTIPNAPGKKASVAIYNHLAEKYGGRITAAAAQEGLQLYGEYVEEAQQQPGSHPNIDLLLDVVKSGRVVSVTVHQQQPNQQQQD